METQIRMTRNELELRIDELDRNYLILRDELGLEHPDVMYLKGHRDALVSVWNITKERIA